MVKKELETALKFNGERIYSNIDKDIFLISRRNCDGLVAGTTLIFYGLALVNAEKYTYSDIKYLGYLEIVLGCLSLFFIGKGLIFWTIGFGVLHIVYGIILYRKYK